MSRWFAGLRVVLRSIVYRARVDEELDEELRYHFDRQVDEGRQAGLAPGEARQAALRAMGPLAKSKDESRDLRGVTVIGDLLDDVRYAGRALRQAPGFAVLAIGVMALGIGANTAVFSVVNAVLLRPLPYPGSDRIVTLTTDLPTRGERNPLVSIANFRDWREARQSFEAMATYRGGEVPVSTGDEAEYARTTIVDPQFFQVFGVEPIVGRTFASEEVVSEPGDLRRQQEEAEISRSVLISHGYWQRRFGGDAAVLQKTIRVRAVTLPIVGVLPPGFGFPNDTDIWLPETTQSTSRTSHSFLAVGRLGLGVSIEQAQAELSAIASALEKQYPESNKGRGVAVTRLQEELVGNVRLTLYLLWGVVAIVLLIACANTATLLLSRATARSREMAIRSALGAGRLRIIRQLIVESLLLALVAGAAGMLLALWGVRGLVALTPFDVVESSGAGIDAGVLTFTLAVSLVTSVLFGLAPALHASNVDVTDAMKQSGTRTVAGGGMARTRGVLVVSEIALAVVLLTGAGLLVKTLIALHRVDLGF